MSHIEDYKGSAVKLHITKMTTSATNMEVDMPELPAPHEQFIPYITRQKATSLRDLTEPYKKYDAEMRKVFAQRPDHPAIQQPSIVPVFAGHEQHLLVRARNLKAESDEEKQSYIMPLNKDMRKLDSSPAIVQSLQEFQTNFNVFSEMSLAGLDWSNVAVAGSAVVTSLLAVPENYKESKRALRKYYHEELAPASDVDLFLYGLAEEQAVEKIKQIERSIRDAILTEVTTVRTKNAITIVSEHPTRHVQIVLRLYRSISEMLTGFDVDSSCAAYDGKQVYASPRALTAYMTQINDIDLTRRSPSYENRLSKYAHRGFEIYWPLLDRSRVDPTIFERSFTRSEGLARLLILEKLPKISDREAYAAQRRRERGRPALTYNQLTRRSMKGNIKADHEDEVSEWVDAEDVSDYHTFTIPYGPKFNARKVERLLYAKDLLLNAEWNKPKDREVHLHRHPAFFGAAQDALGDCCGYCPQPVTDEEKEVAEQESKVYISGSVSFIKDDPGRQMIGSFNPLTAEDWTDMAYVGNTERLCRSIVDHDLEYVQTWLEQDGNDPNVRDYTGRTPLHLAVTDSTPEIVQLLIDHGSRLVARLVDGRTALHLAATRGNPEIIRSILRKSEANEEEEQRKQEVHRANKGSQTADDVPAPVPTDDEMSDDQEESDEDSDVSMIDKEEESEFPGSVTQSSFVKVKRQAKETSEDQLHADEKKDEPDVYDVNVVAWDTAVSPLHLAIINGHVEAVKCLVQEFGADVLLPVKLLNDWDRSAKAAILTLVLAMHLPEAKASEMALTLLQLGASCAQADLSRITAFHYSVAMRPEFIRFLTQHDAPGVSRAINNILVRGWWDDISSPLKTALESRDTEVAQVLLQQGASAETDFTTWLKARNDESAYDQNYLKQQFTRVTQPVLVAARNELPEVAKAMIEQYGADANSKSMNGYRDQFGTQRGPSSLLDEVRFKISVLKDWQPKDNFSPSRVLPNDHCFGRMRVQRISDAPPKLDEDQSYLDCYKLGSYARWSAERQLAREKLRHQHDLELYNELQQWLKTNRQVAEKQKAISELLLKFEDLESILVSKGAKTFAELDPEYAKMHPSQGFNPRDRSGTNPIQDFAADFIFHDPTVTTDEVKNRFVELFDAAWAGDSQKLKQLTLVSWKNAKGDDQPPLRIAVQDEAGFSPFSIAVLRGHLSLGATILDIARAQYEPWGYGGKRRYHLKHDLDSVDESDGDGADDSVVYGMFSELVDEEFTIETIGEVSLQVKSRTHPSQLLTWGFRESWLPQNLSASPAETSAGKVFLGSNMQSSQVDAYAPKRDISLIHLALREDNLSLLQYLLSRGEQVTESTLKPGDEDAQRFFTVNSEILDYALKCDKPHLLAELMKRTGAGLPLNSLIEKFGIEIPSAPNAYLGLSVYGKKRKDWAKKSGGRITHSEHPDLWRPPLLMAAKHASVEIVEWLLGNAPLRAYQEFAQRNQNDKRVKLLEEAPGGFEGVTDRFLNTRSHLVLHCSLLSKDTTKSARLAKFLLGAMPATLEARNSERLTPLHVAFRLHRLDLAKILIDAGADQTARDASGNNIVHHLLQDVWLHEVWANNVHAMLELIDKRILPDLMTERSGHAPGSTTPLAQLISRSTQNLETATRAAAVFKALMKHSSGSELQMIDGAGHTPLHLAVVGNSFRLDGHQLVPLVGNQTFPLVQAILEYDPNLLFRENATGRTPLDHVEDDAAALICRNEPSLRDLDSTPHLPHRRFKNGPFVPRNLLQAPLSDFATDDQPAPARQETTLALLHRTRDHVLATQGAVKRQLVSLNEANEVARRLALRKSQNSENSDDGENEPEEDPVEQRRGQKNVLRDEVQLWLREGMGVSV